jgi:hypothetical protein
MAVGGILAMNGLGLGDEKSIVRLRPKPACRSHRRMSVIAGISLNFGFLFTIKRLSTKFAT